MVKIPDFMSQDQEPEPDRTILQSLNIHLDEAMKVQNIGTLLQQYFLQSAISHAQAQAQTKAQTMVNSNDVALKIEEPGQAVPGPSGDNCTPVKHCPNPIEFQESLQFNVSCS